METNYEYTLRNHPTTGETYAVAMHNGTIILAAGPIYYKDAEKWTLSPESIADYVLNQDYQDAANDAEWLEKALAS